MKEDRRTTTKYQQSIFLVLQISLIILTARHFLNAKPFNLHAILHTRMNERTGRTNISNRIRNTYNTYLENSIFYQNSLKHAKITASILFLSLSLFLFPFSSINILLHHHRHRVRVPLNQLDHRHHIMHSLFLKHSKIMHTFSLKLDFHIVTQRIKEITNKKIHF